MVISDGKRISVGLLDEAAFSKLLPNDLMAEAMMLVETTSAMDAMSVMMTVGVFIMVVWRTNLTCGWCLSSESRNWIWVVSNQTHAWAPNFL